MTVNDSKSYFDYLNKLVSKYNNTYHRFSGKKSVKNIEASHKATKVKVGDRVR